jgi:hypothetical protein
VNFDLRVHACLPADLDAIHAEQVQYSQKNKAEDIMNEGDVIEIFDSSSSSLDLSPNKSNSGEISIIISSDDGSNHSPVAKKEKKDESSFFK